jgi:hypothetical protein
LIFPSPSQPAISIDFNVILVLTAVHGQKAHDRCHRGDTIDADFARVGRKHHDLANGESMAYR